MGSGTDIMKKLSGTATRFGLLLALGLAAGGAAYAAEEGEAPSHFPLREPERMSWTFSGPFGSFDRAQLQRGFKVFREVCSSCHSLNLVPFRALGSQSGPGFSEAEVATIAAEYQIADGPDDAGDMFERPGKPFDHFPAPFPNEQAAMAANGGAAPPDLSLMAKARNVGGTLPWSALDVLTQYQEGGPDYIHALLTGYGEEPPANIEIAPGTHYNPYFNAGVSLAMSDPLADGQVTYTDGTPETVDQYARDVAAFLMWTAEPHLVDRKRIGFQVAIFLLVFATLMYLTKKRVWARAH